MKEGGGGERWGGPCPSGWVWGEGGVGWVATPLHSLFSCTADATYIAASASLYLIPLHSHAHSPPVLPSRPPHLPSPPPCVSSPPRRMQGPRAPSSSSGLWT